MRLGTWVFFFRNQSCNEIFVWLLYKLHSPYDNVFHYDKLSFLRISENPRLRVNTFNDVASEQWKRCSCVHNNSYEWNYCMEPEWLILSERKNLLYWRRYKSDLYQALYNRCIKYTLVIDEFGHFFFETLRG